MSSQYVSPKTGRLTTFPRLEYLLGLSERDEAQMQEVEALLEIVACRVRIVERSAEQLREAAAAHRKNVERLCHLTRVTAA